jgi:AMP phosphorylase
VAAQGGNPNIRSDDLVPGRLTFDVLAKKSGYVNAINNKQLVKIARASGAPKDKGAGVYIHKKEGSKVDAGEALLTIHSENDAKLQEAIGLSRKLEPITTEGMVLARLPGFRNVRV